MLTVVGEFSFCAFVSEEFDLAVGEFGGDGVLKRRFAGAEIFGFGDESDGHAFDSFGVAKVGGEEEEADAKVDCGCGGSGLPGDCKSIE